MVSLTSDLEEVLVLVWHVIPVDLDLKEYIYCVLCTNKMALFVGDIMFICCVLIVTKFLI